jgi:hypothetical protein
MVRRVGPPKGTEEVSNKEAQKAHNDFEVRTVADLFMSFLCLLVANKNK